MISSRPNGLLKITDAGAFVQLGLHTLRKALSIIPQDPILFAGTIRSNLDPFGQHDDYDLNVALQQTNLISSTSPEKRSDNGTENKHITLDSLVDEDGSNFSLGQKQLIAFARALVRGGKVIIVDEGTSAVSPLRLSTLYLIRSRPSLRKTHCTAPDHIRLIRKRIRVSREQSRQS